MRLISCLDIKNNIIVKGTKFKFLKKIGNPINFVVSYENNKIDEIIVLDITKNYTKKSLSSDLIKKISKKINVPLSIGGGINNMFKINKLLKLGADRIIINSYSYNNIKFIKKISKKIGSQCLIIAIDVKKKKKFFFTYKNSGFIKTNFILYDWVLICKKMGAGEILITSILYDGKCKGYHLESFLNILKYINISIIISGGMGSINDVYFLYYFYNVKNFLIAGIFHNKFILPKYIKKYIYIYK